MVEACQAWRHPASGGRGGRTAPIADEAARHRPRQMDRLQSKRRGRLHVQPDRDRANPACLKIGSAAERLHARVPVKGKFPIGPMPISPAMLLPVTFPVKASVSGIGLVIETFQATSSPSAVPSKISVEFPSAPCVPVSVLPALFRLSVALRSPIGVVMTRFQFPSTAIDVSFRDPAQNRNGFEFSQRLVRRYSVSRRPSSIRSSA